MRTEPHIRATPDCMQCFLRQATEAAEMAGADEHRQERLLKRVLRELAESDWNVIPVTISQRIQRIIREETGQVDPYLALKDRMNRTAIDLIPTMIRLVAQRPDPRDALVRLVIAGNLLDAGSTTRMAPEELNERINSIWHMPLVGNAEELFNAAGKARRILYLADNAGEIVFDRMLIEALPAGKVTVAVRAVPVINDATIADADAAGIPAIAKVITNGSDAPGTIVHDCSDEFRACFDNADLIIAKGQGNYETLAGADKDIFFLLTVKCRLIADHTGVPIGTLVLKRSR